MPVRKGDARHLSVEYPLLALTMYDTLKKRQREPKYLEAEISKIKTSVAAGKPYNNYEHHYNFLDGTETGDPHNENVVKTCVSFLTRRHIDGTANECEAALNKLLRIYEPDRFAEE